MASCCLGKIGSRVKGHHVYIYPFKVGKILNCSIENDNKYSKNATAVFSVSKKMVGPESLAKILFPLMKCQKILEIKVGISGEKRAAPKGTWILGGGIEILTKFYVYGARIHNLHVRKVIKNADAEKG